MIYFTEMRKKKISKTQKILLGRNYQNAPYDLSVWTLSERWSQRLNVIFLLDRDEHDVTYMSGLCNYLLVSRTIERKIFEFFCWIWAIKHGFMTQMR